MDNELEGRAEIVPEFSLLVFDSGEDVDISIHVPREPDIRKHASLGMIYGLALLTLERQGLVQEAVDHYLAQGPMNEVDCLNAIHLLLQSPENDSPA